MVKNMKRKKGVPRRIFRIGTLKTGNSNLISDVKGVTAGHVTIDEGAAKTGVTAVLPHQGNLFRDKVMAACHVINGFGKSTGTIQIDELGTLEAPIILTNTLSTGDAFRGIVEYTLEHNPEIGRTAGTVNPVVCECNDSFLNDIRAFHVKPCHVKKAIEDASVFFAQGDVGAGRGMSCYKLKGGIGSSSRIVENRGKTFTVGSLVLSNFGQMKDLVIGRSKVGESIYKVAPPMDDEEEGKGSIAVILATDAPMSSRQLKRLCKRASVGINRTGSYIENGSGEIAIAFTTANRIDHFSEEPLVSINMINEETIDPFFLAVTESTEEAILNSLIHALPLKGRDGNYRRALSEFTEFIPEDVFIKEEEERSHV